MISTKPLIAAGLVAASLTTAAPALATSGSIDGNFRGNKYSASGTVDGDSASGTATVKTRNGKTYTATGSGGSVLDYNHNVDRKYDNSYGVGRGHGDGRYY